MFYKYVQVSQCGHSKTCTKKKVENVFLVGCIWYFPTSPILPLLASQITILASFFSISDISVSLSQYYQTFALHSFSYVPFSHLHLVVSPFQSSKYKSSRPPSRSLEITILSFRRVYLGQPTSFQDYPATCVNSVTQNITILSFRCVPFVPCVHMCTMYTFYSTHM